MTLFFRHADTYSFFFLLLLLLARYIASLERLGVNSEFRNIHREERERDCADQSDQCR